MQPPFFAPMPTALPPGPKQLALAPFRPQAKNVVGLLRHEIAKRVAQILHEQPTDGLFAHAHQNQQLSATAQVAEQVYEAYFSGQLREVTKYDFIACAQHDLFASLMQEQDEKQIPQDAVYTRQGIAFIDHSVVETMQMREQMKSEQLAITKQKKAIQRAYHTKVTKLFREREDEIMRQRHPDITDHQLAVRHTQCKSYHFTTVQKKREKFIQEHPLTNDKERLRTFAIRMYRDHIKFAERGDFLTLTRHALYQRHIDPREVEHARQRIRYCGQQVLRLASEPRASVFSPQELDEWETKLNEKYQHLAQQGRTYCADLYHRVRTIQQHGMPIQEVYHTLSQLPIYATPLNEPKPSVPDLFPHYPKRQKQTRVPFTEAVTRVIEAHPHRYEQDILWQLFFRYNYWHKNIKPLPPELHEQAQQGYRKRKQREREQKTATKLPPKHELDLFEGEMHYDEKLIDFLAGRISWVGR